MNDLISRQGAINEFSYCQTYLFDSIDRDPKISLEDAIYAIEQLPSAQQWIPCSERMPDSYDRVFCFQPKGIVKDMWIGYFDDTVGVWVTDDGWEQYTNPVTAWMPLPDPYKED